MPNPTIDIIIPTFQEVDNALPLLERINAVRQSMGAELNVTFVDDDSNDGIEDAVRSTGFQWARVLTRKHHRGLSTAVIHGIQNTANEYIIVMDADLSHPPEKIPALIQELIDGSDFVVGSRYTEGGTTDDDWGFLRWLNSRIATFLARPFTNIKDPMSGFFALRRKTFQNASDLNPVGYKIGLELIVKCGCKRVTEVPIHFQDRIYGSSKLTFTEQLKYIQHIRRLFIHKFSSFTEILQFLVVGGSGVFVNLGVLTTALHFDLSMRIAVALAIWVSLTSNFILNRRFTFSHAKDGPFFTQYVRYALSVSLGAVVNYLVTVSLIATFANMIPQVAAVLGIFAGTLINYVTMKYLVFRHHHVTPR